MRCKIAGTISRNPLHFYTGAGLTGVWSDKGEISPVNPSAVGYTTGPWPTRFYGDVTDESDAAFEKMVQGFYHAVLTDDPATTAHYVDFPLQINVLPERTNKSPPTQWKIATAADLKSNWNEVFPASWRKRIATVFPHGMATQNGTAMLGAGLSWFGPKGAKIINVPME